VPQRVEIVDDSTTADAAYRMACAGTAMLWRGDFHNARQLLQAMARRAEKPPQRKQRRTPQTELPVATPAQDFHRHRLAQSQRARMLAMLLLPFEGDYGIALRRAPDVRLACTEAWGPAANESGIQGAPAASTDAAGCDGARATASVASLRELLGITSAHEWRRKGVEIAALGAAPNNRIYPHYGVFSPVRGEYLALVASAPLPATQEAEFLAFDIGTGTGVLSALLARRGVHRVVATDLDPRALACAHHNLAQLGLSDTVQLLQTDLFPSGRASLVVCNPPWLPARAGSAIERAVYDEDSRMLLGFLAALSQHLAPGGEGWLILSDFAEHLGLRSRAALLAAVAAAGLQVVGRLQAKPLHPKAGAARDALHAARAAEVTSLWRLRSREVAPTA